MANAIIIFSGFPVQLSTNSYSIENPIYMDTGQLYLFDLQVGTDTLQFQYFNNEDFNSDDQKKRDSSGYYQRDAFFNYKKGSGITYQMLKEGTNNQDYGYLFPILGYEPKPKWGFAHANVGDLVKVKRLNPIPDFTTYYINREYTFKAKNNTDGRIKQYMSVSDFPPVNTDPNSPDYSIFTETNPEDQNQSESRVFYAKNFGNFINTPAWSSVGDDVKEKLARLVTEICWKRAWIVTEIDKFAIADLSVIKTAYNEKFRDNISSTYDALSLADRIVGDLLWKWGYYYNEVLDLNTPFDVTPILPTTYDAAYLDTLNHYFNAINNFYINTYYKTESELFPDDAWSVQERSDKRVMRLIKLLPDIALSTIPAELRLRYLDELVGYSEIKEDRDWETDEGDVLKLLNSFSGTSEANMLLDFLAVVKNGNKTRYEMLYKLMDDARLTRYPFMSIFFTEANNRQFYNFLLYEKWKISKYNMYFVPPGVTPIEGILNPNAFFLDPGIFGGASYFKKFSASGGEPEEVPPIIEFSFEIESPTSFNSISTDISYKVKKDLDRERIIVNQVKTVGGINAFSTHEIANIAAESEYGRYHIYQPITIIGYNGSLDFNIPQFAPIPAFLFYYSTDFTRLKTWDALFSFAIETAIDVGLFFATGGAGLVSDLKYLKYINKIGAAFRGGLLPAEEAVVVWRGAQAGTEVLSVSAGVLHSTTQLIANTTTNQDTYDLMQKVGKFFLLLTFASAGGAIYTSRKAAKSAGEVLDEIEELSDSGIAHDLSSEVVDVLYSVRDASVVSKTLFRNRITSFSVSDLGETNYIADLFDNLSESAKTEFWDHFVGKVDDTEFWKLMNKTEEATAAARMEAWINAPSKFKFVRREIDYLENVIKLQITDRKAYEHLAEFGNRPKSGQASTSFNVTGGHKFKINMDGSAAHLSADNGVELLDPTFSHVIDNTKTSQRMIDYLNNSKNNLNQATILPNGSSRVFKYVKKALREGHFEHNDILIKVGPSTTYNLATDFVLNGVVYKIKALHTQLNPNWLEADIIYEHAYALFKKRNYRISNLKPLGLHGRTDRWIEVTYDSELMDGTKATIKHVNYQRYNLQSTFNDHFSYFHLEL